MLEKSGQYPQFRVGCHEGDERVCRAGFHGFRPVQALEAASFSLATQPDAALDRQIDELVTSLAHAQQPDGYLNTYFIVKDLANAGLTSGIGMTLLRRTSL